MDEGGQWEKVLEAWAFKPFLLLVTQCIKMPGFPENQEALGSECTLVHQSYCFFQVYGWLEATFLEETLVIKRGKEKVGEREREKDYN